MKEFDDGTNSALLGKELRACLTGNLQGNGGLLTTVPKRKNRNSAAHPTPMVTSIPSHVTQFSSEIYLKGLFDHGPSSVLQASKKANLLPQSTRHGTPRLLVSQTEEREWNWAVRLLCLILTSDSPLS